MEKKKEPFYNKFVYENKFLTIESGKEQQKYWVYYFSLIVFTGVPALLSTIFGYSFLHLFSILMLCCYAFVSLIAFAFTIKLVKLENKYCVFKRKPFFAFSIIIPYLIMAGAMASAFFTANPHINEDGLFLINSNPVFYLSIFVPLFLGYVVFIYYAFMKCFAKFKREEKQ